MKNLLNSIGLAAFSVLFTFSACNNKPAETETATEEQAAAAEAPVTAPAADTAKKMADNDKFFTIKTSAGNITVKLYKECPLHQENFSKLVDENFYNGVLFHRVIKGFMVQTGDPDSKAAEPNTI
jgi:hypothetical protein